MISGNNTAGDNYTLMCTANIPSDSNTSLKWLGPNGDIVKNMANIGIYLISSERSLSSGIQYSSSITFSPLQVSHNGTYTCTVPSIDTRSEDVIVNGMYTMCANLT
jgi:FtsP/CotA-like multicopper oxidase with cupredoxin domain